MLKNKIILYPNSNLEIYCQDVKEFNEELHLELDQMRKVMEENNGMGLAHNQLFDSGKRVFITQDSKKKIWEFINPVIIFEDDVQYEPEGCLSFPGAVVSIKRFKQVTLVAQDRNGEHINVGAFEKEAVCIQHEMEHLNGITFLSKLSRQQKREVLRSIKK